MLLGFLVYEKYKKLTVQNLFDKKKDNIFVYFHCLIFKGAPICQFYIDITTYKTSETLFEPNTKFQVCTTKIVAHQLCRDGLTEERTDA